MDDRGDQDAERDERRWQAVCERAAGGEDRFVYAVASTRVFCRPGCPARRPRRDRVAFFAGPAEARAAGYRACRRCRPDEDPPAASAALARALGAIAARDPLPGVARLAAELGWSERHLRRIFVAGLGITPGGYLRSVRAERARERLARGEAVTEAAVGAGFGSSRAFYEHGASRLGMAPARFRGGGAGLEVAYSVVASPLGLVLVAATDRGVCAVRLGEDEAALEAELAAELPGAVRRRDDAGLAETAAVVVAATRGAPGATSLPLDQRGTAFQAVVWEALRAIPHGETRSYAEVAAAIGRPSATRAVAGACAANPVLLAVPCHRVVRSDGGIGGFRYGTAVKAALLEAEAARAPQRGASPRR